MPRVAVLILHEKAILPVSGGLDVGHIGRAKNEKRFISVRVERVHLSPDILLCWILDPPFAADIQGQVQSHALRWRGCRAPPVVAAGDSDKKYDRNEHCVVHGASRHRATGLHHGPHARPATEDPEHCGSLAAPGRVVGPKPSSAAHKSNQCATLMRNVFAGWARKNWSRSSDSPLDPSAGS